MFMGFFFNYFLTINYLLDLLDDICAIYVWV